MNDTIRAELLDYFSEPDYEPLTAAELRDRFDLSESDHSSFLEILEELEQEGQVAHLEGRGWFSPRQEGWIVARLTINRKGFGFARPIPEDDRGDIFVDAHKLKDAHDRDLVLLKARKPKRKGPRQGGAPTLREGRVLHVLRRSPRLVVGRYIATGDAGVVEPSRHDSTREIYIAAGRSAGAEDGDRVMTRLIEEPTVEGLPSGEVIAVVGDEQAYRDDLAIVRSEYRLPTEFPPEVEAEVQKLPRDVGPAEIKGRVDRRDETVITIDPSDARDFDDAITVRREKGGRFRVGVFIADVAAYVKAGSAIDKEALERGTSVYLPGLVIPMLPERLSNDLCSLRPRVDRLARGVWMTVEKDGSLGEIELERSVICSRHRFTYAEAQTVIDGDDLPDVEEDLIEMIEVANELRALLRGRREKTGSLNLDLDAQRLVLDDEGEVAEIRIERGDESHQLVEECMLLANEAVARVATERNIPILRRVHPEPSEEDIDEFIAFCQTVIPSVKLNGAGDLQRAVDAVRGKPEAPVVNFALLRTLTQATYSAEAGLHFALAKEEYCHFTSPIRRYPDLQVHRALDARLFKDRMPKAWKAQVDNLEEIAGLCSRRERQAEEAEREMTKLRVISWLRRHIGERFSGIVTGVLEYGFFVRLDESLAEGMVHVRHLGDDYFEYQERDRSLRGRSSGRVYRLGTRVEVELVRADPVDRHVDLQVVEPESEDDESGREGAGRRAGASGRNRRSSRKTRGRRR